MPAGHLAVYISAGIAILTGLFFFQPRLPESVREVLPQSPLDFLVLRPDVLVEASHSFDSGDNSKQITATTSPAHGFHQNYRMKVSVTVTSKDIDLNCCALKCEWHLPKYVFVDPWQLRRQESENRQAHLSSLQSSNRTRTPIISWSTIPRNIDLEAPAYNDKATDIKVMAILGFPKMAINQTR